MDVSIKITRGGGKKQDSESKSVTLKEVQTKQQVVDALDTTFKDYFKNVTTLDEVKPRSKSNKA
jgi:hypothetical protein